MEIKTFGDKNIIVLEIERGSLCPYFYVGDGGHFAFVRIGNESVPADAQNLKKLSLRGSGTTFDALFTENNFEDYDFSTLRKSYLEAAESILTDKDFRSFELVNAKENVNNAAIILADAPGFRQSRIFCTRWNGLDKASGTMDALDDGEYSGSVLTQLTEAMAFFRRNTHIGWKKLSTKRISLPDYPERAVFELLVNALVHRDYMIAGSEVHLDIFDDRIEIVSPGGMYDGSRIQDCDVLSIPSRRRNPLLADMFSRLKLMERKGSGFEKVLKAYQEQPGFAPEYTPYYTSDATWFTAVLPNLNDSTKAESASAKADKVGDKVGDKSKEKDELKNTQNVGNKTEFNSREKILELISADSHLTIPKMAEKLGISLKGVEKQIQSLKQDGILRRVGARKNGYWEILNSKDN